MDNIHHVYLHGLLGDHTEFDQVIDYLQESKIKHHRLKIEPPKQEENFKQFIPRILAQIKNLQIKGKINLIGFSMGGRLAFYLKYYYPTYFNQVIILSAQMICHEDKASRKKVDRARLDDVNNEAEFKEWAKNFFMMDIYGSFYQTSACHQKIDSLRYSDLARYQIFFNQLSVTQQPEIELNSITWQNQMIFISGKLDEKYSNLAENYQQLLPNAQFHQIDDCAHALHLERPKRLAEIIKASISV